MAHRTRTPDNYNQEDPEYTVPVHNIFRVYRGPPEPFSSCTRVGRLLQTPICVVACALAGRDHIFLYLVPGSRGGRWPIPIAMGSFSLRVTLGIQGGVPTVSQWVRNVPTRIPVP